MKRYGQYCPVARAAEVLAERWTLLVIRELLWGNDRFNAIARGVPRMSPSLLSARLQELGRAGLVERYQLDGEPRYRLTPAGSELMPLVEQIGIWGQRWMQQLRPDEFDPALLMLDISREATLDTARLPEGPVAVHIELSPAPDRYRHWWLVFSSAGVDACDTDPGQPVHAWLETDTVTLTGIWLGRTTWSDAARSDLLRVHGDAGVCRALPGWLGVSRFAAVEPAATSLPRCPANRADRHEDPAARGRAANSRLPDRRWARAFSGGECPHDVAWHELVGGEPGSGLDREHVAHDVVLA